MFAILGIGFVIGLQHALEADHVAALAAMVAGSDQPRRIIRHGFFWGLGHALALSAFAGIVILVRGQVPDNLNMALEMAVGLMMVVLGGLVIWRVVKQEIHFHVHHHRDGLAHFHAHSHAGETGDHKPNRHQHQHKSKGIRRSLFVGVMHGLAGSAALVAMAAPGEWAQGVGFVALFGLGSIAGMVMLSAVIALPLKWSSKLATGANNTLQIIIGLASIGIGVMYLSANLAVVSTLMAAI